MEDIGEIKTETMGKKSEGRRGDSGWSGSIVFWPSPPPLLLCRLRMAERYKALQRKAIRGKANERRTRVCKLPQFAAQMNQYRGIQGRFFE